MSQIASPPVVMIGLDGADWSLLDRLFDDGAMPRLKAFVTRGVSSTLDRCGRRTQFRRVLSIPPSVWHGYMVMGEEETILMYYITSKYDEDNPDEERMTPEESGVDWSVPVK